MSLSAGSISRIKQSDTSLKPILQVSNIKAISNANQVRYRFQISDGIESLSAMPASQLNSMIVDGVIKDNSIIRLLTYQTNAVNNQIIVIILSMELVSQGVPMDTPTMPPQQAYSAPVNPPSVQVKTYQQPPAPAPTNPYANSNPYSAAPPAAPTNPYANNNPYANKQAPPSYGSYGDAGGHGSNRAVVREEPVGPIVPISAINPYSSKWTIKARITAKSEKRSWSNARGEGTLFSIDLLDANGGEIRGTFFKDACEKYFPILEEGKVYSFSNGVIKVVQNRQYSSIKNQYEITFNSNSDIRAVMDDQDIKAQHYNFVKIDSLAYADVGSTVDVIGVVRAATDPTEIVSTKMGGKTLVKRDLTLIDDSGSEVKVTIWGDKATASNDWISNPIVAFKGVKIGDYGGKNLGTLGSSIISINPNIEEGLSLYNWKCRFDGNIPAGIPLGNSGGSSGQSGGDSIEKRKNILSIKDEGLGQQEKPDYITVKGTIVFIKHDNDPWYTACPTPGCNKKVFEGMGGQWSCEKCNQNFPNCNRRYILSCVLADPSGSTWISSFNDTAEKLLNSTAENLYDLKSSGRESDYETFFSKALFKTYIARLRIKQELVNEEMKVKSAIFKLDEVNFVQESRLMIDAINKY